MIRGLKVAKFFRTRISTLEILKLCKKKKNIIQKQKKFSSYLKRVRNAKIKDIANGRIFVVC